MKAKAAVPAVLLCVLLATATPAAASANSGPAYWESAPSFSVTPLRDCPVAVDREDLSFDFSKNKQRDYSPSADVTAAYRMSNPTGQAVRVQMAFPLIAKLPDVAPKETDPGMTPPVGSTLAVSVGGKNVPFEILPGGAMPEAGLTQNYGMESGGRPKTALPGFDQILKSVSAATPKRKIVTGSGRRYDVTVEQGGGVQVRTSGKGEYLLSRGFNGMSSEGSSVTLISNGLKKGESVSVLALGSPSGGEPDITPLTSDGKPEPSGKLSVRKTDCSADDYVREMLKGNGSCRADRTENLLPRLASSAEDSMESFFAAGNHAFGESNLYDFLQQERLVVLCFEAEFPAGGTRAVTVRYAMSGSMDERKTREPVYSYAYFLNPAKGWADFRDLNIRIVPPAEAPNLVASSFPFAKSSDGVYTLSMPSLPQNDLTFSLYKTSKVEPKSSPSRGTAFLLLGIAAAAAVCFAVFFCRRHKKAAPPA